jgi:tRNA U55 pseudouridine synthase TruB
MKQNFSSQQFKYNCKVDYYCDTMAENMGHRLYVMGNMKALPIIQLPQMWHELHGDVVGYHQS